MKIAITARGKSLQDNVAPRFGRAACILLFDTETDHVEVLDNTPNINVHKGAGIQAASMICEKGADALLTGFCGPNAFKTCIAGGVKVVNGAGGKVEQAIRKFLDGELQFS